MQKHVLDHLWQYVEVDVVMIDGWPHHPITWGRDVKLQPLSGYGHAFYVCPETGVLLRAFKARQRAKKLG